MEKPSGTVEDTLRNREIWVRDLFYVHKRSSKLKTPLTSSQQTLNLPPKYKHITKDYALAHLSHRSKAWGLEAKQGPIKTHSRHSSVNELRPASQCLGAAQHRVKGRVGRSMLINDKENSRNSSQRSESVLRGLMYKLAAVEEYKAVEQAACKNGSFRIKSSSQRSRRAL